MEPERTQAGETRQKGRSQFSILHPAFLIPLILFIALVVLFQFTSLGDYQARWAEAMKYLKGHQLGWLVPVAFVALMAALMVVGTPRLLLCFTAGAAFGFLQGLLLAEIGALLGSYALFLFVRRVGRERALQRWPALARYSQALGGGGFLTALIGRQLPINGFFISVALALTGLTHGQYLLGTALGLVPAAIPATLMGAGLGQRTSLARSISYVLVAVCWLLVAGLLFRRLRGWSQRSTSDAQPPPPK